MERTDRLLIQNSRNHIDYKHPVVVKYLKEDKEHYGVIPNDTFMHVPTMDRYRIEDLIAIPRPEQEASVFPAEPSMVPYTYKNSYFLEHSFHASNQHKDNHTDYNSPMVKRTHDGKFYRIAITDNGHHMTFHSRPAPHEAFQPREHTSKDICKRPTQSE